MQVTLQETKRMAEEAKWMRRETQEQVKQAGQSYQSIIGSGLEAVSRSFSEGFQGVAAEITNFSKKRFEDVVQTWEQFLRARSFEDVVKLQNRYVQRAYEDYTSQMSRLGEIYLETARNAAKQR